MDVLLLPLNPLGRNSDPDSTLTPASFWEQAMGQTLSKESLVYFINLKLTFIYYVTKSPSFCELKQILTVYEHKQLANSKNGFIPAI